MRDNMESSDGRPDRNPSQPFFPPRRGVVVPELRGKSSGRSPRSDPNLADSDEPYASCTAQTEAAAAIFLCLKATGTQENG